MPIVVPVRFRYAAIDLWFDPNGNPVHRGDHVIVETERGQEIGLAVDEAFNVNEETLHAPLKPVIRVADEADLARADELDVLSEEAFSSFKEIVERSGLDMKPVACEHLFDGDKIVCYFAADDRIDFRDLVRDLAAIFKLRVDMRQIGVRDEARLVGGFGHCGQELCCKRFGREFEPVSIRMAKEQDLPLNPAKISGACGRLMCCLRYEYVAYKDFKGRAPKQGSLIDTPLGTAKVMSFNTPRELVTLRLENGKQFEVPLKDMSCASSSGCCGSSDHGHTSCCVSQGGEPAGSCCGHAQHQRPNCVSREMLEKLENQTVSLLLSQLDSEESSLEQESESLTPTPVSSERRSRRKRTEHDKTQQLEQDSSLETEHEKSSAATALVKRRRRPGDAGGYAEQKRQETRDAAEGARRSRRRKAPSSSATQDSEQTARKTRVRRTHNKATAPDAPAQAASKRSADKRVQQVGTAKSQEHHREARQSQSAEGRERSLRQRRRRPTQGD